MGKAVTSVEDLTPERLTYVVENARDAITPCLCGCGEMTKRRFAPGHDAQLKRALEKLIQSGGRQGTKAEKAMTSMGWKVSTARKATEVRETVEA